MTLVGVGILEEVKSPLPRGAAAVRVAACGAVLVAAVVYPGPWLAAVLCAAAAWAVAGAAPRGSRTAAVVSMGRVSRPSIGLGSCSAWALSRSLLRRIHAAAAAMVFLIKRLRGARHPGAEFRDAAADSCSCASATSLLDLPDLALDGILSRLPAESLLQMGGVCKELRARCTSDLFWEALVDEKWGKIAGVRAYRRWRDDPARRSSIASGGGGSGGVAREIAAKKACERSNCGWSWVWPSLVAACLWPLSIARDKLMVGSRSKAPKPDDSLMAWYWALETGSLWFHGQVFNRENGHVGFLLSCYDAELCYVRSNNTFRARYPPQGRVLVLEDNIPWERLRASPVDTPAQALHISDCLAELQPGDHIEVQWRRTKEFPYGWWYGIVGHSESCSSTNHRQQCSCRTDDTVWLVFNQYTSGSRWKRAAIDRRNHREEGNDTEGYYGGIRKLRTKDEISVWETLWPADILE